MERWIAAAGGLGLWRSSAAFKVAGIKQSGGGLPQSKAAAPQSASGPSEPEKKTSPGTGTIHGRAF
jgi:hypothetical protein